MKSSLFVAFLFFLLMPLFSSAQKSQKGKGKPSPASNTKAAVPSNANNFYKHYVCSTPNGFNAILDLHRIDSLLFGNYYDNSIDAYVYLTGKLSKKTELKLSYTDGRAVSTKKKELKDFSIVGNLLLPDSLEVVVSLGSQQKRTIKFTADYADALPFDLFFKQNASIIKSKGIEAKYTFSMSSLVPAKTISPITDSISTDLKKIYFPKKYKQVLETKNKLVESIEKNELAAWKKQNSAFSLGKSKLAANLERAERAEIFFNSSDLISIAYHSYSDDGAARPSSMEIYKNYDLKAKKTLAVGSLFAKASTSKLLDLIAQTFLKEYNQANSKNYSKISDIGLPEELPLPENITFNRKGMFFIYNEAELGISYQSKVVVFIEFKDLKPFLETTSPLIRIF